MKISRHPLLERWGHRLKKAVLYACRVLLDTVREILDENAFERYLARQRVARSAESYRAFLQDRDELMLRKPRCC